jgi:hypothetical protein
VNYTEYEGWAKDTLQREASITDWAGLSMAQAAGRAKALIKVVDAAGPETYGPLIDHLEKFVETLTEKYPRR